MKRKLTLGQVRLLMIAAAVLSMILFPAGCMLESGVLMHLGLLCFALPWGIGFLFYRCPHCKKQIGPSTGVRCPHCGKKL